jgi:uncharacterized hydrophobic protein (TIGR00271 family)
MQMQAGMARADIERIERTLFFEKPELRPRLIRFFMLILFASVIATGGLIGDSVASVIGAMIIAPLMTPIMGITVALVMGSGPRAWRCAILVAAGIAVAVTVGLLFSWLMPHGWDPTTSSQVIARTSPRLLDLVVALASGGAGAYALSRVDVADALPGVAIAISLVPPLNTAGVLLAGGETDLAKGAALLFITNFAAILLAGTVTFVLTGLAQGVGRSRRELRNSLLAIGGLIVLIAIPLAANGEDLWTDVNREDEARTVVEDWLGPTDWELYAVNVDGNDIELVLGGNGDLPPQGDVVAKLQGIMGNDMVLTARILGVRKEVIAVTPATPVSG